jgi:hypothetical protein
MMAIVAERGTQSARTGEKKASEPGSAPKIFYLSDTYYSDQDTFRTLRQGSFDSVLTPKTPL